MKTSKSSGFTIVELIIVIVVIGVLAAITIASYSSVQSDSRDAVRTNHLSTIQKAMVLYNKQFGNYVQTGCGDSTGSGFLSNDYDGAGADKSIMQCLVDTTYLKSPLADPSKSITCTGLSCRSYMKSSCATGVYLYANLETKGQSNTDTDATCQPSWDTTYGMNYVVRVDG